MKKNSASKNDSITAKYFTPGYPDRLTGVNYLGLKYISTALSWRDMIPAKGSSKNTVIFDLVEHYGGDPIIDLPGNWGSVEDPYWIKPLFFSRNQEIQSDDYKRMRVTGKPTRRYPVRIGLMENNTDTTAMRRDLKELGGEFKGASVRSFTLWANRNDKGLYTNEDSFVELLVADVEFNGQIGII